ncbi:hypothetical protein BH09MYX1_BH09MYX1_28590 [soil metagenome]
MLGSPCYLGAVAAKKTSKPKAKPRAAPKSKSPAPIARVVGTTTLGGRTRPFSAIVHPPVKEGSADYSCRVQISLHRPIDTRIAGATAKQARELAFSFVQSLLPQAMFP